MSDFEVYDDEERRDEPDVYVYDPRAVQRPPAMDALVAQRQQSGSAEVLAAAVRSGADVSITITRRPKAPPKKKSSFGVGFFTTLGVVTALVAVGIFIGVWNSMQAKIVTRAEYDRVRAGMTYEEVVGLVGHRATESESNSFEGLPTLLPQVDAATHVWRNADGSAMACVFVNNRMTAKAQKNLK